MAGDVQSGSKYDEKMIKVADVDLISIEIRSNFDEIHGLHDVFLPVRRRQMQSLTSPCRGQVRPSGGALVARPLLGH